MTKASLIYKNFVSIALAILCFLGLAACRSTSPRQEKGMLDGEDQPVKIDTDSETNEGTVPPSLWSPSQRAANASYFYLLGEYLAARGEMNKAYPLFQASYNLDPNPFLGGKLIASESVLGKFDKAVPEAKRMSLLYPKVANIRLIYGELLAHNGELDAAADELKHAIGLDPTQERGYLILIEAYSKARQFERALSVAKQFSKAKPHSVLGWVEVAKLNLILGNRKEALDPAKRAYELQTGNPELVIIYAMTLELNGHSKQAVQLYEQLYRLDPTNQDLIKRMTQLYREVGNLDDALDLIESLAQLPEGDKPGVQLQKAIILWELKRHSEASQVLDKLAAEYPDSDRLVYFSGLGHERLDQYDRALEIYRSIPETSALFVDGQIRVVIILMQQQKLEEAAVVVRKVTSLAGVPWEAFELAGQILSEQTKYLEAIELVQEGFKKFPDRPRLLFLKGVYLEKHGDIEKCIETMKEVIRIDSTNSSAFNYLGYLFAERGERLEEAEKLILRALELRPNDGFYLDSLGWVLFQKKEYPRALQQLERALEITPKEGIILEHLAEVYVALDRMSDAERTFAEALKTKLEAKDRIRIEKRVVALKSSKKS